MFKKLKKINSDEYSLLKEELETLKKKLEISDKYHSDHVELYYRSINFTNASLFTLLSIEMCEKDKYLKEKMEKENEKNLGKFHHLFLDTQIVQIEHEDCNISCSNIFPIKEN